MSREDLSPDPIEEGPHISNETPLPEVDEEDRGDSESPQDRLILQHESLYLATQCVNWGYHVNMARTRSLSQTDIDQANIAHPDLRLAVIATLLESIANIVFHQGPHQDRLDILEIGISIHYEFSNYPVIQLDQGSDSVGHSIGNPTEGIHIDYDEFCSFVHAKGIGKNPLKALRDFLVEQGKKISHNSFEKFFSFFEKADQREKLIKCFSGELSDEEKPTFFDEVEKGQHNQRIYTSYILTASNGDEVLIEGNSIDENAKKVQSLLLSQDEDEIRRLLTELDWVMLEGHLRCWNIALSEFMKHVLKDCPAAFRTRVTAIIKKIRGCW